MKKEIEHSNINLPKGNPFKVPEGYFKNNAITLKAISKEKQKTRVLSLKNIGITLSIAATLTLLFTLVLPKNVNNSTLTQEDMLALVDAGYISFSDDQLAYLEIEDIDWNYLDESQTMEYLEQQDLSFLEDEYFVEY